MRKKRKKFRSVQEKRVEQGALLFLPGFVSGNRCWPFELLRKGSLQT